MQADRPIAVTSPLGDDVLLFYRMQATEALGQMFDHALEVISEDHAIKLEDLLGQAVTVTLDLAGGGQRHFHGVVSELSQEGVVGRFARYHLRLRPWLWFLTRTADCRIFQGQSVPEIIKTVFGDLGFSDVEDALTGSYAARDYCVQYRETAFEFVSRLMEREGIYYWFKHEQDRHTLVLADSYTAHAPVPGYETIPFYPPQTDEASDLDRFLSWRISQQVQPTSYTLDDYDFEAPRSDIRAAATTTRKHAGADYKVFDYPGQYTDTGVGEDYAKYRLEELTAGHETHAARGTARGLHAGALFDLADHPRADQNKEYLVVSAEHVLAAGGYETGDPGAGNVTYEGRLVAIDAQVPYRTPRRTRKPEVQGPQTAMVVGPSGETVWTDQYGRVKVQFHWDRHGASDENSSCWLRVSQAWAGKTWGAMHLPHVGQEVIVDFLEGDPDRPLVTGRVYNAEQMPPLELPASKYKSIIRDHYGNEIRFDGTAGQEHMTLFSPSHGSMFQLGRSDKKFTRSSSESFTFGDTYALHLGSKVSQVKGNTTSITLGTSFAHKRGADVSVGVGMALAGFVGMKGSVTLGGEVSLAGSWKASYGWSREFKYTKGDYSRTSDSDIVLDSRRDVIACGGKNDHTQFRSNDDEISLSWGKSSKSRNMSAIDTGSMVFAALSGALMGTAGAAGGLMSWADGDTLAAARDRDGNQLDEVTVDLDRAKSNADSDAVTAVGVLAGMVASIGAIKGESVSPPAHDEVTSKVAVTDEQVVIFVGKDKKTKITVSADKGVKIETDKEFRIEAKEDIDLSSSGGNVHYSAPNVEYDTKLMKIKGGNLEHPNLKVLK